MGALFFLITEGKIEIGLISAARKERLFTYAVIFVWLL